MPVGESGPDTQIFKDGSDDQTNGNESDNPPNAIEDGAMDQRKDCRRYHVECYNRQHRDSARKDLQNSRSGVKRDERPQDGIDQRVVLCRSVNRCVYHGSFIAGSPGMYTEFLRCGNYFRKGSQPLAGRGACVPLWRMSRICLWRVISPMQVMGILGEKRRSNFADFGRTVKSRP